MIPVLTPDEMAAVDAAAPEPIEVLIDRAGAAVARQAVDLLGGAYGRRVVVLAGKGNNGADGRAAAVRLRRRGVRVHVIDALDAPARLPSADLVIDAAFGTGFHGEHRAPDAGGAPVLAVDIPSGVDGLTGEEHGAALAGRRGPSPSPPSSPGSSSSPDARWPARSPWPTSGSMSAWRPVGLVERSDVTRLAPARARASRTSGRPACWSWPARPG